jgi:hypothetical protein
VTDDPFFDQIVEPVGPPACTTDLQKAAFMGLAGISLKQSGQGTVSDSTSGWVFWIAISAY